jgi:hypothetical protein
LLKAQHVVAKVKATNAVGQVKLLLQTLGLAESALAPPTASDWPSYFLLASPLFLLEAWLKGLQHIARVAAVSHFAPP